MIQQLILKEALGIVGRALPEGRSPLPILGHSFGAVIARHGADFAIDHLGEIMECLHAVEVEVNNE